MAAERGQQDVQQGRADRLGLKLGLDRRGTAQTVAQQRQVAGTAAAGGQAGQRPGEVGQYLQRLAQPFAAQGIVEQPGNEPQPRLNRRALGQRR